MVKIKGKYLAWAIIHLIIFISLWFTDLDLAFETFDDGLKLVWYIGFLLWVGWRFIKNMEEALD